MSSAGSSRPFEHPLAALYQRSVLDPMIEVARAVADDYVARPRHYRSVPEDVASVLEGFRARTGSDPEWPDAAQRAQIYAALFDQTFRGVAAELRLAARLHTERTAEASTDLLEARVRDAAAALGGLLRSLEGQAVTSADRQTETSFGHAILVLRSKEVAAAFGIAAPEGDWPFGAGREADIAASSDGAFLLEEVQRSLAVFRGGAAITEDLFVVLQRVAHYGAATISGAIEAGKGTGVQDLIGSAYGWEQALRASFAQAEERGGLYEPRVVSRLDLDDEQLRSMPTEADVRRAGAAVAALGESGGGQKTCLTGWTRVCDTGPSCTYGWTFRCDTGPTCTSGWTIVCDSGPTCTYGWTLKCDIPRGF